MNEVDFHNFDKLLLELVFQNDQDSQNKRNTKELIQRYGDKLLQERQQILALKRDISLNDEIILDLQKYNRNTDSLVMCISTSAVLEREKDFLQSQLENAKNTFENDKKTYQDSMRKCTETLKQHEEKYKEFAFAKKYHAVKEELDILQNNVVKYDEQQKKKHKIILDFSEPASFGSCVTWSLRLATLKKDTNETLCQTSQTSCMTTELMEKIEEIEQRIKYIEQSQDIVEEENESNTYHTSGSQQNNLNEEGTSSNQSSEKRSHLLHLPDLPQNVIRPPREIKLMSHFCKTENMTRENNGEPQNNNRIVANEDTCMEKNIQEPLINNGSKSFIAPETNLQHQGQLRLGLIQPKIHSQLKETANIGRQQFTEVLDTSKDSGYVSQGNSAGSEEMECQMDETPQKEVFVSPSIPSPFIVPNPPSTANTSIKKRERNKGRKNQNFSKSAMDLFPRATKQTEASPSLNLFKTSTPKTPNLCSFDSFATVRFADQQESYKAADASPTSPAKDIGNLFQKMEGDDDFAFLFASKSSQASDDDKDDFTFTLPFGQEGGNSMEFESAESSSFSFF